jgi:hypothetical protein
VFDVFELVWLAGVTTSRGLHSSYIEMFTSPFARTKYGYTSDISLSLQFPLISHLDKIEVFPDNKHTGGAVVGLLTEGDPVCPQFEQLACDYIQELCGTITDKAKLGQSAPVVLKALRETCINI